MTTFRSSTTLSLLWLALAACADAAEPDVAKAVAAVDKVAEAGPFQPNWKSLEQYQIPQWY